METEKYKKELNEISKNLDVEKLISTSLHRLEMREQSYKNFYESKEETAILKEWNFDCSCDLENYEKELKLGKFGD